MKCEGCNKEVDTDHNYCKKCTQIMYDDYIVNYMIDENIEEKYRDRFENIEEVKT